MPALADFPIDPVMAILAKEMPNYPQPLVDQMGSEGQTPFRILIATLLSLRTKDTLTAVVAPRFFAAADTPETMLALGEEQVAKLIYPVMYYQVKARNIIQICSILLEKYDGKVPADLDLLLELPGVGRKTANLVLTMGFNLLGICVDIHVHRICNRWGYVATRNPDATELVLREILPERHWIAINGLLVTLGQNICRPTSPHCSICPVSAYCARVGVTTSR